MKNAMRCFSMLSLLTTMTGCAICCSPEDYTYATFGGKYERVDPSYGRVGSIYSDPNATLGTPFEPKAVDPAPLNQQLPQPGGDESDDGTGVDTSTPSILYGTSNSDSAINGPLRR